jgi:hypothetical protein
MAALFDLQVWASGAHYYAALQFDFDREYSTFLKIDVFVKSHQSRHPGKSLGPELLVFPGFRPTNDVGSLSPE